MDLAGGFSVGVAKVNWLDGFVVVVIGYTVSVNAEGGCAIAKDLVLVGCGVLV